MQLARTWVIAAIATLGLAAPSALAGMGSGDVQIKTAKRPSGPYEQSSFRVNVNDKPKNLYFKVLNQDDHNVDVAMMDSSNENLEDYGIRWYRGKQNITGAVKAGTYEFSLKASKAKVFRARLTPKVGNPGETCLSARMHVEPDDYNTGQGFYVNDDSVCG